MFATLSCVKIQRLLVAHKILMILLVTYQFYSKLLKVKSCTKEKKHLSCNFTELTCILKISCV